MLYQANSFPSSTKVHDLSSDGRESHSKEKPDKLSFINAIRSRHNHKSGFYDCGELNVSKNDLFSDSVNMNIHTSLKKFSSCQTLFSKIRFTHQVFFFSYSVKCILNCLLFNVRCVLFHFFHAIVRFCVVFVVEIIKRAIPVKYECTSTEITKKYIQPPQHEKKRGVWIFPTINWRKCTR